MKDGHRLPNKECYEAIDAEIARRYSRPTIGNAIDVMGEFGNEAYVEEWQHIELEKPFSEADDKHDLAHLCTRLGHTPEQEQNMTAFDIGLRGFSAHEIPTLAEAIEEMNRNYQKNYACYFLEGKSYTIPSASKRSTAIYFAAGLYLRQKFEALKEAGLLDKDYDTQQQFAVTYAKGDSTPHAPIGQRTPFNYARLPYDMAKLTPKEWRAITAVATGIYSPDHTPYPERLKPIHDVLLQSGLLHNLREQPLNPPRHRANGEKIPLKDGSTIAEKWQHPSDLGR